MELNENDKKILASLYHDVRKPVSEIARKCNLSREQVGYKLKKFIDEGIIRKFITFFNYSILGYPSRAIILVKLVNPSKIKDFHKKLEKDKIWISKGLVHNKYDMFIQGVFKDESQISKYLFEVMNEHNSWIEDCLIIKPYYTEMYPLKFLGDNRGGSISFDKNFNEIKIDEKDKKILTALDEDGRTKLIDIAQRAGLSAELTLYRLRKLIKEKVIVGSRILFDMDKLGYHYSMVLINLKNLSQSNQNKLKQFAYKNNHVNSIILSLTKPHCLIQLFHKEDNVIRKTIDEIKELFKDESIDIDVLLLKNEGEEINTLPFLR